MEFIKILTSDLDSGLTVNEAFILEMLRKLSVKKGYTYIREKSLVQASKLSLSTIQRILNKLIEEKRIVKTKKGKTNQYSVCKPSAHGRRKPQPKIENHVESKHEKKLETKIENTIDSKQQKVETSERKLYDWSKRHKIDVEGDEQNPFKSEKE